MSVPPLVEALTVPPSVGGFDPARARLDFPVLKQKVHGQPLVYLDNSATTQKPIAVLDAVRSYYLHDNANVHRAVHQLSERATRAFEGARQTVRAFLNAASTREVLFTRGTTEGINLVAQSWGRANLKPGDEVVITWMEHHSNIVPWQMVCQQTGAVLRVVPITDDGELLLDEYERLLGPRTRIVSVVHLSNALGTVNPIRPMIEMAHNVGALVLVDGAQSIAHLPIDVRELDCDFFAFSGHKMYGPTGVGVLYGKEHLLEAMPPWQGGGDMIRSVSFAGTTYADLPSKFEAGTPHIAGAIGLAAAIDYFRGLGLSAVLAHEDALLQYATRKVREIEGVRIVGHASHKAGVLSFVVVEPPMSSLDVGTRLDLAGVAIRTGHHCCQPVMERFGIPGTARASLGLYNTTEDIDRFVAALKHAVEESCTRLGCPMGWAARVGGPAGVEYPGPFAASPEEAAQEVADVFEFLDNWAERYQHLIELGEKLPPFPDAFRTECNRVRGCQSTAYLHARMKPDAEDVVEFLADSDAELVRGLIALLVRLFSGQKASAILAYDVDGLFARLGLDQHLSMNRRNGLAAMVQRIREFAAGRATSNCFVEET